MSASPVSYTHLDVYKRQVHGTAFRMLSIQMNGIKLTFCSTNTAANTFIFIYNRSSAAQTTCCFFSHLFLCKGFLCISKGFMSINVFSHTRYLTGGIIVFFHLNVTLVKFNKLASVSSDCQTAVRLHKTVNGNRTFFSRCNGINGKFRSCVDVYKRQLSASFPLMLLS